MRKFLSLVVIACALLTGTKVSAQGGLFDLYNVESSTHGTLIQYDPAGNALGIFDDGGTDANYMVEESDYYLTVQGQCTAPYYMCLLISDLNIDPADTLYIYDGSSPSGQLRAKINDSTGHVIGQRIFVASQNSTGMLTVRFRRHASSQGGRGFSLAVECASPCETVVPVIDSVFYRTRNGQVYDEATLKNVPVYDTSYMIVDGDTTGIDHVDTNYFVGANLCIGDGVIFRGHGEYSNNHGYYNPADSTTLFTWSMGLDNDSLSGYGLTSVSYEKYQKTGCFDVVLSLTDQSGCNSRVFTSIRVRTSGNPIKTIFTLDDICNRDSLMVNIGYDGENATLTLRKVVESQMVSKTNEVRTFIPDGPNCAVRCYSAPVTFEEFPAGKTVASAADVCSICINMEHTYMGDLTVSIVCPTGQESFFFYGNQDSQRPSDAQGGGSKYMGFPIEGQWDGGDQCDSLQNPFGVGVDYCFSRNSDYVLVTGDLASSVQGHPGGADYDIVASAYMVSMDTIVPPNPTNFTTRITTPTQWSTIHNYNIKMPSNHLNKSDYYTPYSDFSELVGCPLNGTWEIKVCDQWGSDNGWVFNWSMDICGVSDDNDCKYNVGIDSLIWKPKNDPQYHDYELGHYRGLEVRQATPTISYILSPDTAGTFPIDVLVYDDFGCLWDTVTRITSYWTPEPSLGADTMLCGVKSTVLDATDRHTANENYSYLWEPFGQTTDTIHTATWQNGVVSYVAEITNTRNSKRCTSRDTILVRTLRQPVPSFEPSVLPLEGCSPMTVDFTNYTIDGNTYHWEFGDGIVSDEANPRHTYSTGIYELKYYVTSADGCIDSVYPYPIVSVFDAPQAGFSWEPTYPSMLNPVIHLHNETTPMLPENKYFWEVQYDRDNTVSVQTLTEVNSDYIFESNGEDISGNYTLRLIARTDNVAPSGNVVYCADTAENSVLLVNDFLQFPNVVTPNGDGINDVFVIQNLIEGMGYPNNTLDVYNKWGTRVFHKENISTAADFWDPAGLPAGTYFFRFSARGYNGNIEHNGAVEVIVE